MSKLIKKVREREEYISSFTEELISPYRSLILDAIARFYSIDVEGMIFDNVQIYPHSDSEYLMISVHKTPKPGDVVRLSNDADLIVINNENKNKYRTVIKLVAKASILEDGNPDNVYKSIRNLLDLALTVESHEYEALLSDKSFNPLSDVDVLKATMGSLNIPNNEDSFDDSLEDYFSSSDSIIEEIDGFDVTDLSEEQKRILEIQLHIRNKKVH